MKCDDVQLLILEGKIDEVNEHLKSCQSCQTYAYLNSHQPAQVEIDFDVDFSVEAAIKEAAAIKKKYDIVSLLVFMTFMFLLFTFIILKTSTLTIIKVQGVLTAFMPITLLILVYIKRKELTHVR